MNKRMILRTQKAIQRRKREEGLVRDWVAMNAVEGAMRTVIVDRLMKKYRVTNPTVYAIVKRYGVYQKQEVSQ